LSQHPQVLPHHLRFILDKNIMAIYRQEKDENGNTLLDSDGNTIMILIRADDPNEEIYMVYEDPTKVETLEEKAIRLSSELNEIINQLKQ